MVSVHPCGFVYVGRFASPSPHSPKVPRLIFILGTSQVRDCSALSLQLQCQCIAALSQCSSLYPPADDVSPPCL